MRLIAVLHRRKFFESEKLYSKASTNFLKKGNFTSEFNVTEDLLKIIRKKINAFRLCRLFEYRFSNAPRNKEVREDDFYILSCKTKGNFPMLDQLLTTEKKNSVDLEKIGISENEVSIATPTNLREILMSEKEKEFSKKCFQSSAEQT